MMAQLALAFDDAADDDDGMWTYHYGMPDRSGLAQYTHLVRWHGDPPETLARGGVSRAAQRGDWVSRAGDADAWAARIEALMRDGVARSWNRIAVELEGVTADALCDCEADAGLWLLVERRRLGWACEEGAVFFAHVDALEAER